MKKTLLFGAFILLVVVGSYLAAEAGNADAFEGLLVIVVLIACGYFIVRDARKARIAKQAALGLGYSLVDTRNPFDDELIRQTKFWLQRRVRFRNVFQGAAGDAAVTIADGYVPSLKGGRALPIAAFAYRDLELPRFQIVPELVTTRLDRLLHIHKIDFSSNAEFSRKYRVHGEDELAIRHILNVDVLTLICESKSLGPWSISAVGNSLFLGRPLGGTVLRDFPVFLQESSRVASAIRQSAPAGVFEHRM